MGLFNMVDCVVQCPRCHNNSEFKVQFKYAESRQHEYVIGDSLIWDDTHNIDRGNKDYKRVVVYGIGGPCTTCSRSNIEIDYDFDVFIEQGRINAVKLHSEEYDYTDTEEEYIVIEE